MRIYCTEFAYIYIEEIYNNNNNNNNNNKYVEGWAGSLCWEA
jgi:hypothetical protein